MCCLVVKRVLLPTVILYVGTYDYNLQKAHKYCKNINWIMNDPLFSILSKQIFRNSIE